jgi:2-polyprenyl-6-methoxyphenol hydroxylase-like FAD-dependent oxidoreductase
MNHTFHLLCLFFVFVTAAVALSINTNLPIEAGLQQQVVSSIQRKKEAVVVGAGPVGIAAALTLASAPHCYNVHILESSPQTSFDVTRAFLYNVNLRGQKLTSKFSSMQLKLQERGVATSGPIDLTIVPADPNKPLVHTNPLVSTNQKKEEAEETITKDSEKQISISSDNKKCSYWIPRHEMCELMLECVKEHQKQYSNELKSSSNPPSIGQIEYHPSIKCVSLCPSSDSSTVLIDAIDISTGDSITYNATLVVGADGINSQVRQALATESPHNLFSTNRWSSSFNPKRFIMKKWRSPSSFLRIKVLQFPPQFRIPNQPSSSNVDGNSKNENSSSDSTHDEKYVTTKSESMYVIRPKYNSPKKYVSLGLLPMKNNNDFRPTNIITRPDHEIWSIRDGKSMRKWFVDTFPRFSFDSSNNNKQEVDLISDDEFDRFAKAEGTRFPACQYSPGMATCNDEGTCAVVLVGDAIHAFPPDIGQGINAGLTDVVALDLALQGRDTVTGQSCKSTPTFKENIERYQKQHEPEIAALIRLARFGGPYQYKQPHRIDRFRRNLWTFNVLFRMILNKLTFGLVPLQCLLLAQNHELTFRQVMRRADTTSRTIKVSFLGLFVWMVMKGRLFSFPI